MTVCIAAVCESENVLITASDRMISMGGYYSGDDIARKIDPVQPNWMVMIAGDDISPAVPIVERIKSAPQEEAILTRSGMASLVKLKYRGQRLEQIEDEILSNHGLTWDEFKQFGKERLDERTYERVSGEISDYSFSLELLVGGIDPAGRAHVFTVTNPGKCEYYDRLGFWAIGSGSSQALASLFATRYNRYDKLAECIAKVLIAKFMAESAMGVGKRTLMFSVRKDQGELEFILDSTINTVRNEWEKLPKIPQNVLPTIQVEIDKQKRANEEAVRSMLIPVPPIPEMTRSKVKKPQLESRL